jgi:hypothetical protein
MNSTELESIDVTIEQAEQAVALAESLQRLGENKDFKKLIHENYFKEEPVRLVLLKAVPQMAGDNEQKSIDIAITGIGAFRQYLSTVYMLGNQAQKALQDSLEERENILAGQV